MEPGPELLSVTVIGFLGFYFSGIMGPSISAFIGDQFHENQVEERSSAYSWYYMWYAIGSLPAGIILPILLDDSTPWFTFMVPLVIFLLSMPFFFLPSGNFNQLPPLRGTYTVVGKILVSAASKHQCSCCGGKSKISCLDAAKQDNDHERVEDVKTAVRVLSIFVTLPFFWGIFFQINSLWVFQASGMML